ATWLAERHGLKALLINPAVRPHALFDGHLGSQQNLYTGETWQLTLDHIQALGELEVPPPADPQRFQVWLQTGDETLDYRQAQAWYRACALRSQPGGDHTYQGLAPQLPALLSFAGYASTLRRAHDLTERLRTREPMATYNADAIEVLSGLDPVRKRPGMYTDTTRPNHLAQEVIDNSVDEALAGHAKSVQVILHVDNSLEVIDDGRGMPVDIHPE